MLKVKVLRLILEEVKHLRNLIIAIVVVVLVGGFFLVRSYTQTSSTPKVTKQTATASATAGVSEDGSAATIVYTSSGFSPAEVEVNAGGTITWVNEGTSEIQIGANPHPIHTGNKEVSGGGFVLKLRSGEQATVTILKVGTFGYHDHLNSRQGGSIIVK